MVVSLRCRSHVTSYHVFMVKLPHQTGWGVSPGGSQFIGSPEACCPPPRRWPRIYSTCADAALGGRRHTMMSYKGDLLCFLAKIGHLNHHPRSGRELAHGWEGLNAAPAPLSWNGLYF